MYQNWPYDKINVWINKNVDKSQLHLIKTGVQFLVILL